MGKRIRSSSRPQGPRNVDQSAFQHGSESKSRVASKDKTQIVKEFEQHYIVDYSTHQEWKKQVVKQLTDVLHLGNAYYVSKWLPMLEAIQDGFWPSKDEGKGSAKLSSTQKTSRTTQWELELSALEEELGDDYEREMSEQQLDGVWVNGAYEIDSIKQSKNRALADQYLREACRGSKLSYLMDNYVLIKKGDLRGFRKKFDIYWATNESQRGTQILNELNNWSYTHGEEPNLEDWHAHFSKLRNQINAFDAGRFGISEFPIVQNLLDQCELDPDLKGEVTKLRADLKYLDGTIKVDAIAEKLITEQSRMRVIRGNNRRKPNQQWGRKQQHNQPKAYNATAEKNGNEPMDNQPRKDLTCHKWREGKTCPFGAKCKFLHGNQIPAVQTAAKLKAQKEKSEKNSQRNSVQQPNPKTGGGRPITCFTCGGKGHTAAVCPNSVTDPDPKGRALKKQKRFFKRKLTQQKTTAQKKSYIKAMKATLASLSVDDLKLAEEATSDESSESEDEREPDPPRVKLRKRKKVRAYLGRTEREICQKISNTERSGSYMASINSTPHPPTHDNYLDKILLWDSGSSRTGYADKRISSNEKRENVKLATAAGNKKITHSADIEEVRAEGVAFDFNDAIYNPSLKKNEILVALCEVNYAGVSTVMTSDEMYMISEDDMVELLNIHQNQLGKDFLLREKRDMATGMFTSKARVPIRANAQVGVSSLAAHALTKGNERGHILPAQPNISGHSSETKSEAHAVITENKTPDTVNHSPDHVIPTHEQKSPLKTNFESKVGQKQFVGEKSEELWAPLLPGYKAMLEKKPQDKHNLRGESLPSVFSYKQATEACKGEAREVAKETKSKLSKPSQRLSKTYSDAGSKTSYEIWHKRFAHIKGKGKHLPAGVSEPKGGCWCNGCVQGKMRAKPFKSLEKKEPKIEYNPCEKWHCDWKDFKVSSLDGAKGRFLFADQELGYWVSIFADSSDEATEAAEEVRKWVLTNTTSAMRALHMDNGTYFTSAEMYDWASEFRVKLSFSSKDCPQQNSVVERATQTLDDLVIANMMGDLGDLPKAPPRFWAEACKAIETVHNSICEIECTDEGLASRDELLGRSAWKHEDLRALFCEAWFYNIKSKRRGALASKAKPGVFLGYAQNRRSYRIWDLEKHKVREIAIQHTVTYENSFPFQDKDNWRVEWLEDIDTHFLLEEVSEPAEPEPITRVAERTKLRRAPAPSREGLESIVSQAEN